MCKYDAFTTVHRYILMTWIINSMRYLAIESIICCDQSRKLHYHHIPLEISKSQSTLECIFGCRVFSYVNILHVCARRFSALVKDLEMLMQNLMSSVFKTVNTVEEGVRLLDIFRSTSTREVPLSVFVAAKYLCFTCLSSLTVLHLLPFFRVFVPSQAIKRFTEEKVEEVYNIFNKELKMVNKELNQSTKCFPDGMPHMVAHTYWVRALRQRLERPMEVSPLA